MSIILSTGELDLNLRFRYLSIFNRAGEPFCKSPTPTSEKSTSEIYLCL